MLISCSGLLVEDIDSYNSVYEMFRILRVEGSRKKDYVESFSNYWEGRKDTHSINTTPLNIVQLPSQ